MALLTGILGARQEREGCRPLYEAVVGLARDRSWYAEGKVPDTIDGRFDMVAAVLSLVLLRLEEEGPSCRAASNLLTELFIEDMDGSLRQIGIGDLLVGKHVTRLMGALGGRLGAYRSAFAGDGDLDEVVRRNVFREAPPTEEAVGRVAERLKALHERLKARPAELLLAGELGPA